MNAQDELHALRTIAEAARKVLEHFTVDERDSAFTDESIAVVTLGQFHWEGFFDDPAMARDSLFGSLRVLDNVVAMYDALNDDGVLAESEASDG